MIIYDTSIQIEENEHTLELLCYLSNDFTSIACDCDLKRVYTKIRRDKLYINDFNELLRDLESGKYKGVDFNIEIINIYRNIVSKMRNYQIELLEIEGSLEPDKRGYIDEILL